MLTACVPGGVVQKRDDDEEEEDDAAAAASFPSSSVNIAPAPANAASPLLKDEDLGNQRMQRQQSTDQVRDLNLIPPICSEPQQPRLDLIVRPGLNDQAAM